MMQIIESVANEKVKYAVKIAESSKARKENKMFFLEGMRLCKDAVLTGVKIEYAFFTHDAAERYSTDVQLISGGAANSFLISKAVENKLACTQTSQGVFCVCRIEDRETVNFFNQEGKYIALENIQDPANLGAICRTAEALGVNGAIIYSGCDIYSPKAQRAAMGSLLRLKILRCENLSDTIKICKNMGIKVYATTPDSSAMSITKADMSGGIVAVIGNEGNGITDEIFSLCEKVTIPMLGRAESLNASMAAAITMWEMMRPGEV